MNYLDIFFVLALAWGAWRGYQRGFVNLLAGWISYLIGGLLAVVYARPLAEAVERAFQLKVNWGFWLQSYLPLPRQVLSQPVSMPAIQQVEELLSGMPVPSMVKQSLLGNLGQYSGTTVGQALAGQLIFLALIIIAVVVLFYGSIFALRCLARWGVGRSFLPLGLLSRGLGLALGFLGQLFWLAILVGIMRSLFTLPAITSTPGFLSLARQLYSSGVAVLLGDFYDWMLGLLHTLIQ